MAVDKMALVFDQLTDKYKLPPVQEHIYTHEDPKILKSSKNATLEDFISMVTMISSKALKKYNAKFVPDEGAVLNDPIDKLEQPTILYSIISRKPKHELKPRHSEEVKDVVDNVSGKIRHGHTWSQRQDCVIQFNIVASDYDTANKVMTIFEDTIFAYTGYFKNNGVAEMYFLKHFTDENLDRYRQFLSIRSLQYFIEIEKLITIFDTTLEDYDI